MIPSKLMITLTLSTAFLGGIVVADLLTVPSAVAQSQSFNQRYQVLGPYDQNGTHIFDTALGVRYYCGTISCTRYNAPPR